MIRLVVAKTSRPTGAILEKLLLEQGLQVGGVNPTALVSYGVRLDGHALPTLNAMAGGRTKYEELETLRDAGVRVPWFCRAADWRTAQQHLPALARKFSHHGGTDIRLIRTAAGLANWSTKRDFFVQFVPNMDEYRVQIYRSAHLGSYHKVLLRPEQQKRAVGRNHRNGYGFQIVHRDVIQRAMVDTAKQAVKALGLDFGAVDMIHGTDGNWYVLEVNTAPGGEDSRQWLNSLAGHIKTWVDQGYPARKQE